MKLRELAQAQKLEVINNTIVDLKRIAQNENPGFICCSSVKEIEKIFDHKTIYGHSDSDILKITFPELYEMILIEGQTLSDKHLVPSKYFLSLPWPFDKETLREEKTLFKISKLNKLKKEIS